MFRHPDGNRLEGRRVVIVDDDQLNLELLKTCLQNEAAVVLTYDRATACLEALTTLADLPDVFLLDIQMPELSGVELLHTVRSQTRFDGVPVVAVTARAMEGDREHYLAQGFDDYLTKPLKIDDLLDLVKHAARKA